MSYASCIPWSDPFPHGLFEKVARECNDDDILVEVGVGFGHGTVYMMECLAAYGKKPRFYALDLFDMKNAPDDLMDVAAETPWGEPYGEWLARNGGPGARLDQFLMHLKNVVPVVRERLTDWSQFPPSSVCDGFKPDSVAFAFLNASRTPQIVEKELAGWLRAVRPGGLLALHGHENWETIGRFAAANGQNLVVVADDTYTITKA